MDTLIMQTFGCFLEQTLDSTKLAVWAESSAGYSNQSRKKPPLGLLQHLEWGKWSRNLCKKAIYICLTLVRQVPKLFSTWRHLDHRLQQQFDPSQGKEVVQSSHR